MSRPPSLKQPRAFRERSGDILPRTGKRLGGISVRLHSWLEAAELLAPADGIAALLRYPAYQSTSS